MKVSFLVMLANAANLTKVAFIRSWSDLVISYQGQFCGELVH